MTSHLREVTHEEILAQDLGTVTIDRPGIKAILDFIFVWLDLAKCTVQLRGNATQLALPCNLSVDTDNLDYDSLMIQLPREESECWQEGCMLQINVEVFRRLFRFTLRCEFVHQGTEHRVLTTSLPEQIDSANIRHLPRVRLTQAMGLALPPLTIADGTQTTWHEAQVLELGLHSILVKFSSMVPDAPTVLRFGALELTVTTTRRSSNTLVLQMHFRDGRQAGAFFDIYRLVAYPNLRPRHSFPTAEVFALYMKTNYLKQFLGEDAAGAVQGELEHIWDEVGRTQHGLSNDYVAINGAGDLCGASSLTQAFSDQFGPFWVFHQMCAVNEPDMLQCTRQLYNWRTEYLLARPESTRSLVWFRSSSRWLERIYVKLSRLASPRSHLRPVLWVKGVYQRPTAATGSSRVKESQETFGALPRQLAWSDSGAVAAIGPEYLNACASLSGALHPGDGDVDFAALSPLLDAVLARGAQTALSVHVTVPATAPIPNGFTAHSSDRFMHIAHEDLALLLSCVDHSIALTQRKFSR